jgi:hypothetical protein
MELVVGVYHAGGYYRTRQGGRREILGLYAQVVLTLVVLRQNLPQTLVGDLLRISQPTVSRIVRRILPLIAKVVSGWGCTLTEVIKDRVVLVDGTLIPTRNRAHTGTQNYSGKHRRQGLSVQVAADLGAGLLAVSDPVPGSRHDAAALAITGWEHILDQADWVADRAYTATTAITPKKKPHHQELPPDHQKFNRALAAIRNPVERCIAHLKNWKVLATGYRGRLTELPTIIRIVTQLEFYRLGR